MKKFLICISAVGVVAGVAYLIYKSINENNEKLIDGKIEYEPSYKNVDNSQKRDFHQEICEVKSESDESISERHAFAGEIMKEAYSHIMEDFVEDPSDANMSNDTSDENIDNESISVMKEIDSISDELNDLLKAESV